MAEVSLLSGNQRQGASLLTSGLLAGGTLADFLGTIGQGRNSSAAARANARIANQNAEAASRDARAAALATQRSVEDVELIGRIRRGSLVASSAARGVQTDTGSPLENLASDAFQTGRAAAEIQFQGDVAVQRLEVEAAQQRAMQGFLKKQAKRARTSAILGAVGGLASNLAVGLPIHLRGFNAGRSLLTQSLAARESPQPGIGLGFLGPAGRPS